MPPRKPIHELDHHGRTRHVESLYHDHGRHSRVEMIEHNEHQANQAPEDAHGPNYDNDASGWVRGARGEPTGDYETGETKPGFDHNPVWKMANKGNDWRGRK